MSIYTCIMQIEQRTKIWSLLLVTINKILCQFFEFTQNLKRSQKALKLLASLHELTSLNIDSQSQTTCNFCIRKVHSVINDTIPFEVACALLEDVEKIVTILQTTSN